MLNGINKYTANMIPKLKYITNNQKVHIYLINHDFLLSLKRGFLIYFIYA